MNIMKKLVLFFFALMLAASTHAAAPKDLGTNPPEVGSPADVWIVYKKAAAKEDIEQMRALVAGTRARAIEHADGFQFEVERAQDIDWEKPMKWVQKIEGDTAKVGFQFTMKSSGRRSFDRVNFSKVDGVWKYGD